MNKSHSVYDFGYIIKRDANTDDLMSFIRSDCSIVDGIICYNTNKEIKIALTGDNTLVVCTNNFDTMHDLTEWVEQLKKENIIHKDACITIFKHVV